MRDVKKGDAFPLQTFKNKKWPYTEKDKPFRWTFTTNIKAKHTHTYTDRFQNLAINIKIRALFFYKRL